MVCGKDRSHDELGLGRAGHELQAGCLGGGTKASHQGVCVAHERGWTQSRDSGGGGGLCGDTKALRMLRSPTKSGDTVSRQPLAPLTPPCGCLGFPL